VGDSTLRAYPKSFATVLLCKWSLPEFCDLSAESNKTLELYRSKRGVRFVELIAVVSNSNWYGHGDAMPPEPLASNFDQATSGWIQDLKSCGMLDEMLIFWTTEFSRTPFHAAADARGREHHHSNCHHG
jgi:hypothetical protein